MAIRNIVCCAECHVYWMLNFIKCLLKCEMKSLALFCIFWLVFWDSFCSSLHCRSICVFLIFRKMNVPCFMCVCVSMIENVCEFGIGLLTLNVESKVVSQSMAGVWLALVTVLHYSRLLYRDVKSFAAAQHGLDVALDIVLLAQEALPIVPNNQTAIINKLMLAMCDTMNGEWWKLPFSCSMWKEAKHSVKWNETKLEIKFNFKTIKRRKLIFLFVTLTQK